MHTLRFFALAALCSACSPRLALQPYAPLDGAADGDLDPDAAELVLTLRRDAGPRDTEAHVEGDAPDAQEPRDALAEHDADASSDAADSGPTSDDAGAQGDVVDAALADVVSAPADVLDVPEPRDVVSAPDVVDAPMLADAAAPRDVVSAADAVDAAPEPRDAPVACATAHTCEECLRLTHCGWCGGSSTCMAGSPVGLDVGICWRDYTFVCSP